MEISFKDVVHQAPIMINLLPYLSVIDYINLRRATVNAISPLIVSPAHLLLERFVRRMRDDLLVPEETVLDIVKLLIERNGFFLSGGFLLALLRGDSFDVLKQDVDFFVTEDSLQKSFLGGYSFAHALDTDEIYANAMPFSRLFNVSMLESPAKLQFVVHESKEKLLESVSHFDILPCRNLFNMTSGLRIFALEDVTLERTTINTLDLIMRLQHLIPGRSFLKDLYQRNADRIVKYRKRGFDIVLTIPDEETLKSSIVLQEEHVLRKTQTLAGCFEIMGIHNPASCVRTADCRCKAVDDPKSSYCWENFRCGCDHHVYFRSEAITKYIRQKKDFVTKEHIEFWSSQTK